MVLWNEKSDRKENSLACLDVATPNDSNAQVVSQQSYILLNRANILAHGFSHPEIS